LAGKYVDEGVMDFVEGKYGRGHNYGIMLGYLVVAPLDKAVAKVISAMNARKATTFEKSPCQPDVALCFHPHTHRSSHLQREINNVITLVHVFLDFS
ncbi:hypothetical protein HUU05_28515, partial [candidate division KSB1 bacterium]|nr:hypothetical protein [candidate division KSB1 bacterium]